MLKHYVIFTFEPDFFGPKNLAEFQSVFTRLEREVPGVLHTEVHPNCVNRPANMDLMVIMDLADETVLGQYLNHPAHVAMGQKYNPHVTKRVSFDYPTAAD